MKNINLRLVIAIFAIIFVVGGVQAQDKILKKADKLYEHFAYAQAADEYIKYIAETNDDDAKMKLANCYRFMRKTVEAEAVYAQLVDGENTRPDIINHYAEMLKMNGKYKEAKRFYKLIDEEKSEHLAASCDFAMKQKEQETDFEVNMMDFNSEESDFGPAYYGDGIVFSSARKVDSKTNTDIYTWTGKSFYELYYVEKDDAGEYVQPELLNGKINTQYHEGQVDFVQEDSKVFFTRNRFNKGKKELSEDGILKLDVYEASIEKEKWTDVKPINLNNSEYSVGHPSLNEEGKILFFASDMPGGFGGSDIYKSKFKNGEWEKPENLGAEVNTSGDELFPYFINDSTIYFSSNYHYGFGGLDIFKAQLSEETATWGNIKNLGIPINSSQDDFGIIYNEETREGYFTSRRAESDDIYSFKEVFSEIKLIVLDKNTKEPIEKAVVIVDTCTKVVYDTITNPWGKSNIRIKPNHTCIVTVNKEGYMPVSTTLVGKISKNKIPDVTVYLEQLDLSLVGRVINKETGLPIEGAEVLLYNDCTKETEKVVTGPDGTYKFELQPDCDYKLTIVKDGYFNITKEFDTHGKDKSEKINQGNIGLQELVLNKAVKIDNIYYDLDKWNIRPDAARELDKVVKLLRDNPGVFIELSSHTDSRGGDSYNARLSQNRATSAVDYIVSRGVTGDRIIARGYGETSLVNNCTDGVMCSEYQHEMNRRTEFKVLKVEQNQLKVISDTKDKIKTTAPANSTEITTPKNVNDPNQALFEQYKNEQNTGIDTNLGVKKSISDGLIYMVQLGVLKGNKDSHFSKLKDLGTLIKLPKGRSTIYLIGEFESPLKAEDIKEEIRRRGFKDAFVVRYNNGSRL